MKLLPFDKIHRVLRMKPPPHHENDDHHIQTDHHELGNGYKSSTTGSSRHPPIEQQCSSKVGIGCLLQLMVGRYISNVERSRQAIIGSSITTENVSLLYPVRNKHASKIILPHHSPSFILWIPLLCLQISALHFVCRWTFWLSAKRSSHAIMLVVINDGLVLGPWSNWAVRFRQLKRQADKPGM